MSAPGEQRRNLAAWTESAAYWERHADVVRQMFAPLSDALIEAAALGPDQSVLDVAGGTGEPALRIAERCGPSTRVCCTDLAAGMVAAAKRQAARRGVAKVSFVRCGADALPFASRRFDAAVCRLGAMFFDEPLVAIGEMLRVVKPGGRIAFAVWHEGRYNPFFAAPMEAVGRHLQLPSSPAGGRGAFRFAQPGALAALVRRAEAVEIGERTVEFRMNAPLSAAAFWRLRLDLSETLRGLLNGIPAEQSRRIDEEVERAMQPFLRDGHVSLPARAIIVSATVNR